MTDASLKLLVSSNGIPRALLIDGVEVPGVARIQIDCQPQSKAMAYLEIYVREVHTIRDDDTGKRTIGADAAGADRDGDGQADPSLPR